MNLGPGAGAHQQVSFAQGRYSVDRSWGQLPAGQSLGLASTVAVGSDGAVYLAQRNGPPVLVFEPSGELRATWPMSLAIDPHGINVCRGTPDTIILVDRDAHVVLLCTPQGEIKATLGHRHRPRFQAPFNHPTSAFVARDGEIYIADGYGNCAVHRFSASGEHLRTWGTPGDGPGQFTTPHSVWVDRRNRVLVADRENSRIQLFDRSGNYLEAWTGFYKPMDISEDDAGRIYVSDQIPRVSQLDADGTLIGAARPVWNTPHGMACAPDGRIFFTEMAPSSVVCLTPVDPSREDI